MKVLTLEGGLPIKLWEPESTEADESWPDVLKQFENLARHPLAVKWICGMPDFHLGFGMPIGGVLVTRGGVVPNAVGVDIGCGMIAVRTSLAVDALSRETLAKLRQEIHRRVPVGFKRHEQLQDFPDELAQLGHVENGVIQREWERARSQLGTLGSGNHFIEVQADEDSHVWIMLHSGSRNVGKQVCDHYHKAAKKYMESFHVDVEKDLAFLPDSVPEYAEYLVEMKWCMAFAEANRQEMLVAVHRAFVELGLLFEVEFTVDTHHNFAAMENHFGENVLVHRKGAVKAEGLVTIPGSMGTASYIGEGLGPVESFNTCSHGAGRAMGRKAANRMMAGKHEQAQEIMEHVVFGVREGDYDELPYVIDERGEKKRVYKDIDAVMEAQADLVKPLYRLRPLTVVKG